MELGRPAHVAQAACALLDRLEPELVTVEGAARSRSWAGSLVTVWALLSGPGMVISWE
jgi:hypothetical protein